MNSKTFDVKQINNLQSSCIDNKKSYNFIKFLDFSLEEVRLYLVKTKPLGFMNITLEDCFEYNLKKELLNGGNQNYFNNFHKQSNILSSYNKLKSCLELLTIILNRGEFDVDFIFPITLNISKFIEDKTYNPIYELIGVLSTLRGKVGHFIAYSKSPNDNQWYHPLEDKMIDEKELLYKIDSDGIPYVLFYKRINVSKPGI